MSNRLKNFLWLVFILLFLYIFAHAQSSPSWLLWNNQTAALYKIQDGSCSIYLALGAAGNTQPIAIATGQGCQTYPTINLQSPNGTATPGGSITLNKPVIH